MSKRRHLPVTSYSSNWCPKKLLKSKSVNHIKILLICVACVYTLSIVIHIYLFVSIYFYLLFVFLIIKIIIIIFYHIFLRSFCKLFYLKIKKAKTYIFFTFFIPRPSHCSTHSNYHPRHCSFLSLAQSQRMEAPH